jgi:hypothetical protein
MTLARDNAPVVARELLPGRRRALDRRRHDVGGDAVACGAAGGVGGAARGAMKER